MPTLARIAALPLLAVALLAAPGCSDDPCRPPVIRLETTDRSTLTGPDTPACKAAREQQQNEKKP